MREGFFIYLLINKLISHHSDGYLCGVGPDNDGVPVHGYQEDGEGGEEDTAGL